MVYVDPLAEQRRRHRAAARTRSPSAPAEAAAAPGALVEVPVCYDGPYGPDLGDVAAFGQCSTRTR